MRILPGRVPLAALLFAAASAAPGPIPDLADDWVAVKNESETVEITLPPNFTPVEIKNPARVIHLQYPSGEPWKSMQVQAFAHAKMGKAGIEYYMKFVVSDVGGLSPTFVEGSTTRFTVERKTGDGLEWVGYCEGKIEEDYGYYAQISVLRTVFEEHRDEFDQMLNSLKTRPAPKDLFTVPPGWHKVQNDYFAVIGPVGELKDPAEKKALENRLFRVQSWLDPQSPHVQMLRDFTGDKRKMVARLVLHVYPTREKFQEAAGEAFREGAAVLYLPGHPEKPVIVDGSPESTINQDDLVGAVADQYFESRMPPLKPWIREAYRLYFENASRRDRMTGCYTPEAFKKVKEVFAKSPPVFEDLIAKDEAGMRALGENGAIAAWGFLQFGLHGAETHVRDVFQHFRTGLIGAADCQAAWDKALLGYQESTKKKLKLRDIDSAARKYWKDAKQ